MVGWRQPTEGVENVVEKDVEKLVEKDVENVVEKWVEKWVKYAKKDVADPVTRYPCGEKSGGVEACGWVWKAA